MRWLLKSQCGDAYAFIGGVNRTNSRRSAFVTAKGHGGVGSIGLKKGNVIALFSGAQLPFILRECAGGKYQVISAAYVDGIMNGEAAEQGQWGYIDLI